MNRKSFNLVLNNANVIANSNNSAYRYQFIGGNFTTKNARISMSQATLPYSWFNISTQWNNKKIEFNYTVAAALLPSNLVWTLPDGFYSTADINSYLQQQFISINYYLISPSGQYLYFVAIVENQSAYANQLIILLTPAAADFTLSGGIYTGNVGTTYAGYTTPVGFPGFPTVATTSRITFPSTGGIDSVLGFSPGTSYGNGATNVSQNSTQTPVATPVNSIIFHCNLVSNPVTVPSDILDSCPIESVSFGSNLNFSPSYQRFVSIPNGTYSQLIINLTDENNIPIQAQDSHGLMTLFIEMD
jgi:hypothetical protein